MYNNLDVLISFFNFQFHAIGIIALHAEVAASKYSLNNQFRF